MTLPAGTRVEAVGYFARALRDSDVCVPEGFADQIRGG